METDAGELIDEEDDFVVVASGGGGAHFMQNVVFESGMYRV
jgi:hypothetical protein